MNEEYETSCILECEYDKQKQVCSGCGRTLEEIAEAGRNSKCSEERMKYSII